MLRDSAGAWGLSKNSFKSSTNMRCDVELPLRFQRHIFFEKSNLRYFLMKEHPGVAPLKMHLKMTDKSWDKHIDINQLTSTKSAWFLSIKNSSLSIGGWGFSFLFQTSDLRCQGGVETVEIPETETKCLEVTVCISTLPEDWWIHFLLGIFQGYVSFRECRIVQNYRNVWNYWNLLLGLPFLKLTYIAPENLMVGRQAIRFGFRPIFGC